MSGPGENPGTGGNPGTGTGYPGYGIIGMPGIIGGIPIGGTPIAGIPTGSAVASFFAFFDGPPSAKIIHIPILNAKWITVGIRT